MAGLIALRYAPQRLSELAFVPAVPFTAPPALAADAYAGPRLWLARPGRAGDPTRWLPPGIAPGAAVPAAVFYVHPTGDYDRTAWNADFGDAATAARSAGLARVQASAFNAAIQLWAPRYRQATYGALLTPAPAGPIRAGRRLSRCAGSVRPVRGRPRPAPADRDRRSWPGRRPRRSPGAGADRRHRARRSHRGGLCAGLAGLDHS